MGRLDGKVALITGAARGQGRSHAIRLAEEGADIIAVDICSQIESVPYPMATEEDLQETARLVEEHDRRVTTHVADVRHYAQMEDVVRQGLAEFDHIDIVVANAGIGTFARVWEVTPEMWQEMIDVNLTGVFNTVRTVLPSMIEAGRGGSLILISSAAGIDNAFPNLPHYSAAKHGVTGLMHALTVDLSSLGIRANSIHPTTVDTPMVQNSAFYGLAGAETRDQAAAAFKTFNALPIPWVDPIDVSNAVLYLASDEARYITGVALRVDAGGSQAYKIPNA
ncbi:mycofactocin-coupled SDR family oxidoreductase [Nocardioides sp. NPDC057767]|uniref:mycofactocin-coupled SDR family oxidoreductase n=1 Tax=Nocardioides sp. NPDC057767 TaxID=3346244 RepID=UPI00366F8773